MLEIVDAPDTQLRLMPFLWIASLAQQEKERWIGRS
jgi:hypothetical protein